MSDSRRTLARRETIPIAAEAPEPDPFLGNCAAAESFALMVLGDSMLPEFAEGDVIVIEPEGLAIDGSYVLARWQDDWIFRQLVRVGTDRGTGIGTDTADVHVSGGNTEWMLHALNPAYPDIAIPDLAPVRGVIIQKSRPGRRRAAKRYVD